MTKGSRQQLTWDRETGHGDGSLGRVLAALEGQEAEIVYRTVSLYGRRGTATITGTVGERALIFGEVRRTIGEKRVIESRILNVNARVTS